MRIFIKAALAFGLLSMAAAQARDWDGFTPRQPSLKQSGHWEWNWDGGDRLGIAVPASVHYQRSGPARIVITGPDDLLEKLEVGQGEIRFCRECRNGPGRLDIAVSGVGLNRVSIAGHGTDVQLGRLDQDDLRLEIAGTGQVSAEGRIDRVRVNLAGSGNARLAKATVRRADINIAGSGDVDLTPRDEASINVTGSGNVRMTAAPARVRQSVIGSGGMRVIGN